jgi:hypothetical protein
MDKMISSLFGGGKKKGKMPKSGGNVLGGSGTETKAAPPAKSKEGKAAAKAASNPKTPEEQVDDVMIRLSVCGVIIK